MKLKTNLKLIGWILLHPHQFAWTAMLLFSEMQIQESMDAKE